MLVVLVGMVLSLELTPHLPGVAAVLSTLGVAFSLIVCFDGQKPKPDGVPSLVLHPVSQALPAPVLFFS